MLHIDLSKEIAVVTGGSGELGRVIVRVLARCGAGFAVAWPPVPDVTIAGRPRVNGESSGVILCNVAGAARRATTRRRRRPSLCQR
jgi:NAD(P)-dependent dehydrogenase (short-subunit alcohol dehydrogenase family)